MRFADGDRNAEIQVIIINKVPNKKYINCKYRMVEKNNFIEYPPKYKVTNN